MESNTTDKLQLIKNAVESLTDTANGETVLSLLNINLQATHLVNALDDRVRDILFKHDFSYYSEMYRGLEIHLSPERMYVVDVHSRNKWSITESLTPEKLANMITECRASTDCDDCIDCINCTSCSTSVGLDSCNNCYSCINCSYCDDCYNCQDITQESNLKDISFPVKQQIYV